MIQKIFQYSSVSSVDKKSFKLKISPFFTVIIQSFLEKNAKS
jgi:hypothetical protein